MGFVRGKLLLVELSSFTHLFLFRHCYESYCFLSQNYQKKKKKIKSQWTNTNTSIKLEQYEI